MGVNPPNGIGSLYNVEIYVPNFTAYVNYYNAGWGNSNSLVCPEKPQDGELITVNNKTAGQLASRILQKGVQLDEVVAIKITGKLNEDDWGIIKNELDLAYIDLSGANITAIPSGEFQDKKMLKIVILPESIVEIGANAFAGCKQLEGGLIFNNDVKIGANAFKNTHINSVTFNGTAAVGDYAFQSSSVKNLTFGDNANLGRSAFESVPLTEVVFSGSAEIGYGAFYKSALTQVEFNGEAKIGESAFAYTKISGTLHIGDTKISGTLHGDNIKSIGDRAFSGTLIEKVIVDGDYTVFGSYFKICSYLKEVVFNGEVQTLGKEAFWGCTRLTSIKWPKGLTTLEDNCLRLTAFVELTIPEGVETIGESVFDECFALRTLDIPATVKTWEPSYDEEERYDEWGNERECCYLLISSCKRLEVLSVHWNTPLAVEPKAFSKVDCSKVQLWIPYFTYMAYHNANGWKDFENIHERYGTVTVTAGKGGSVEVHGQTVTEQTKDVQLISGMEMVFTITPKAGYMIESVCLDGEDVTEDAEGNAYGMTYTIEEIDDDYTLEVTFVESTEQEVPVFVSAKNRYGTLIVPFDAELPAGLKAYTVDGADGTSLTLTAASSIQANTAYVIENTIAEDINTTIKGTVVKGYEQGNTTGLLTGVYTKTEAPVGCYVLQNHDGVVAFYRVDGGLTTGLSVGANRCYLNMGSNSSEVKAFYLDGQATGIENLEMAADKAVIYDLSGRRVSKAQKGLYIVNGKKVMK